MKPFPDKTRRCLWCAALKGAQACPACGKTTAQAVQSARRVLVYLTAGSRRPLVPVVPRVSAARAWAPGPCGNRLVFPETDR